MRTFLTVTLVFTLLGCSGESADRADAAPEGTEPAAATARFLAGPYLQEPGQTHMTIMWTSDARSDARVRYGAGRVVDRVAGVPAVQEVRFPGPPEFIDGRIVTPPPETEFVYRVRLDGLEAGTKYWYLVELGNEKEHGTFTTVPKAADRFAFVAYGDSRNNPTVHGDLAFGFAAHAPAFILHVGDMVGSGAYHEWRPQFFEPLREIIDRIPLLPARGNHEGAGEALRRLLSFPDKRFWYSFDYGNAHFVSLDSCDYSQAAEMLAWCEKDLAASKARWKFVFYHYPSYDLGTHRSAWGRDTFVPVFRKHGVDVVLAGHTHVYERFRPMYTPGENDGNPITHIVTGGGGAPVYAVQNDPYLAGWSTKHHFVVFTIEGDTLSGKAITPTGEVIDSFSFSKPDGRYEKAYLEKAFSEKELAE